MDQRLLTRRRCRTLAGIAGKPARRPIGKTTSVKSGGCHVREIACRSQHRKQGEISHSFSETRQGESPGTVGGSHTLARRTGADWAQIRPTPSPRTAVPESPRSPPAAARVAMCRLPKRLLCPFGPPRDGAGGGAGETSSRQFRTVTATPRASTCRSVPRRSLQGLFPS